MPACTETHGETTHDNCAASNSQDKFSQPSCILSSVHHPSPTYLPSVGVSIIMCIHIRYLISGPLCSLEMPANTAARSKL